MDDYDIYGLKYGVFGLKKEEIVEFVALAGSYAISTNKFAVAPSLIIAVLSSLIVKETISVTRDRIFYKNKNVIEYCEIYENILNEILETGKRLGLDNPIDYYVLTEYLYNNGYLVPVDRLKKFSLDGYYPLNSKLRKESAIANAGAGMERNLLLTNILLGAGFNASVEAGTFNYTDEADKKELLDYLSQENFFVEDSFDCFINTDSGMAFKALKELNVNGVDINFDRVFEPLKITRDIFKLPNYCLTKVMIKDFLVYLDLYKDTYFRHVIGGKYISPEYNIFTSDKKASKNLRRSYNLKNIKNTENIDIEELEKIFNESTEKIEGNIDEVMNSGDKVKRLSSKSLYLYKNMEEALFS